MVNESYRPTDLHAEGIATIVFAVSETSAEDPIGKRYRSQESDGINRMVGRMHVGVPYREIGPTVHHGEGYRTGSLIVG
jgi:hypothetical protein